MCDRIIVPAESLNEVQKVELVNIFVDSFAYMFAFTNKREDLVDLFSVSLDYSMMYACLADDKVLGLLGLGTNKKRTVVVDVTTYRSIFGDKSGKMIARIMKMMCGKPVVKLDTDLYIDFLAVGKNLRGQGIGTLLLDFTFAMPEYKDSYLDVLSKNTEAKKLYERLGYHVHKKNYLTVFFLGDGSYLIKMKRPFQG